MNGSNSHCNGAIRMTLFKEQEADFCDSGTQKLVSRLDKYLENAGECVEK
jgi:hypothetical protein